MKEADFCWAPGQEAIQEPGYVSDEASKPSLQAGSSHSKHRNEAALRTIPRAPNT